MGGLLRQKLHGRKLVARYQSSRNRWLTPLSSKEQCVTRNRGIQWKGSMLEVEKQECWPGRSSVQYLEIWTRPARAREQAIYPEERAFGLVLRCWGKQEEHVTDGVRPLCPQLALEETAA